MYTFGVHEHINALLKEHQIDVGGKDNPFYTRFLADTSAIFELYLQLYEHYPATETLFDELITTIIKAYKQRPEVLKQRDIQKLEQEHWFLSNKINGMSLYVDRFCGNIKTLETKLDYFENLGVNFLHLMPVFESPANESDGGYAVSNFRKVDERFGSLEDLLNLQEEMRKRNMYLMIDIVLNHTSHKHEWALKAKAGEKKYQDYFYFYQDRSLPDQYDKTMPEIFPESSPGSFTYIEECNKWVMTVFHNYQWDLNYTNPVVFIEMLDNIFFYANLGVDILRIDAPAFIWKQLGTTCQNLPQAHTLLRLIKQCVQVASPGMALLGEAIVAPKEIMKYFGTDNYTARECDFAYNATHMALQWDMLATGDTKVMLAAQHELLQKPYGTSWITYTRCHDDIGLGYDDNMIEQAGYNSYAHRKYLKEYYSGVHEGSPAVGALFSSNPKTGDARISGSLASLCGLEKALNAKDQAAIDLSIQKIVMMQAHSFFLGGVPMLFYGDEVGYTNDYSYLQDEGKSYDNRWMHRPVIDWTKNKKAEQKGTVEEIVFSATKKLLSIRGQLSVVADRSNLIWLTPHNVHVAGYIRQTDEQRLFCVFNFSNAAAYLTWYAFKEKGNPPTSLVDHWSGKIYEVGQDHEFLVLPPYGFALLEG
ncbi:alpha-amylase family glycosyl hydrolase [Lacibacter sediminis]|uniref:Alpha-glucosidase C-terminal domain-containing protein n=1 Tax=Lacibacter sediminis TaxID=2760713 RepID=A0A7G5XG63_9BACT|nr:alpha-amylase family glycosyl hydrolase [Lacibacter sediminis]QNA44466.1 alpha-glucosidase C-terminal domain-containing protein [Lacibacter sediminis]